MEPEREGKLHLRAYFICCHHCDSCPVSKWENLIYNSLLCLLKGLAERQKEREGMAWVSCLGRNEKCCWKIWELERSTSKEENVKHVYCHSLYSRELLRKVMKHFYTRLQQHFPAILLQSTLLPVPLPLPLLPLPRALWTCFCFWGKEKLANWLWWEPRKIALCLHNSSENNNFAMAIAIFLLKGEEEERAAGRVASPGKCVRAKTTTNFH